MKAWPPPNLTGEGRKVQQEWLYHFLQNPTTIRPWLKIRMPSFDFNAKQTNMTIRYFRSMDKLPMQIETPTKIVRTTEQQKLGKEVFAQYQCAACHVVGKVPEGKDLGSLAPDFRLTKTRLRYEWLEDWLKYPQKLLPGTRMPNLFYYDGQPMIPGRSDKDLMAVRDHIYDIK